MKPHREEYRRIVFIQPPSGGCVLKRIGFCRLGLSSPQPPSGGCVLKQNDAVFAVAVVTPAAFGRLCVETPELRGNDSGKKSQPPSGGCVLKHKLQIIRLERTAQPPSGGCVLKQTCKLFENHRMAQPPSGGCVLKQNQPRPSTKRRQPAAFGRLCVETSEQVAEEAASEPSRLRAAVC